MLLVSTLVLFFALWTTLGFVATICTFLIKGYRGESATIDWAHSLVVAISWAVFYLISKL